MTTKFATLSTIMTSGSILIVRLDNADEAYRVAHAAVEGGIKALEVTLSIPSALRTIERLADDFRGTDVVVGAGTVLDGHAAYSCINAGATLLVSPQLNTSMLTVANRYQAVSVSGALTPTEIQDSLDAGADIVKIFPGELGGVQYAKTILAPLSHAPLLPAGGVTAGNVDSWFAAGVAAVGVGSAITKAAQGTNDYQLVTRAAEEFVAAVSAARR